MALIVQQQPQSSYGINPNATPTIAAGTGAGTGPTISITGVDSNGYISVTTGSAPATSATIATVTFASSAYGSAPRTVILTPANAATAALAVAAQAVVIQANITTAVFVVTSGGTALAATTAYQWYYSVLN